MFYYTTVMTNLFTLSQWDSSNSVANFRGISTLVDWFSVSIASYCRVVTRPVFDGTSRFLVPLSHVPL